MRGAYEHTSAVIFIKLDHFVHRFFGGIAPSLGLLDLLRIAPLLYDEVEDVEHTVFAVCSLGAARWDLLCFETQ